jgi:methionyl-tRNA formyltransferase
MSEKIVFMGSPDFATPTLRALAKKFNVVGVVTQPDRPAGRGRILSPPPVKEVALQLDVAFIQPSSLKESQAQAQLETWKPDLIVVAAYGQILRKSVLELPIHGCINVHASLLPRWRGAAPIQAAILNGDTETGITIMRMDAGVDTGDILNQRRIMIGQSETSIELNRRLADMGAELLVDTLPSYLNGEIAPQAQDDSLATYAPLLNKEAGHLDFNEAAVALARRVRAFTPWPGTYTIWSGQRLKILRAHAQDANTPGPGKTIIYGDLPAFGTSDGLLVVDNLQLAGKKPIRGETFLQGAKSW